MNSRGRLMVEASRLQQAKLTEDKTNKGQEQEACMQPKLINPVKKRRKNEPRKKYSSFDQFPFEFSSNHSDYSKGFFYCSNYFWFYYFFFFIEILLQIARSHEGGSTPGADPNKPNR